MQRNVKFFLSAITTLFVLGLASVAFAQPEAAAAMTVPQIKAGTGGWIAMAAGLAIGIAAFGGALAQGRAAAAALDGIGRNPGAADKIRGPMILGLALIESLVIYALIIAFLLIGKI